ncbi:MAG: RNA methyltransferase [Candidatus Omnitrophica bacterium]|nr:RNA methyltransferase [Candidatus Omnitrophota bacterium]
MRLYGKRPVLERLRAAPESIRALYLDKETDAAEIVRAAKGASCRFLSVSKSDLARRAGQVHAQGVLAEVEEFRYTPLEDLLRKPEPRPSLFLLDRVTDPQNLGAILRTAACLGGIGLILPRHDSAEVNETVLRVACGGENYVPTALVTNLAAAAQAAKEAGYWIAGAVSDGGEPIDQARWPWPLAVVLGCEGTGIRPGLKKHLELTLTLPMPGAALSFNVATAAALIAYEITRRRRGNL